MLLSARSSLDERFSAHVKSSEIIFADIWGSHVSILNGVAGAASTILYRSSFIAP